MDDAEIDRWRARFARTLDGRWATMGMSAADVGYAVWVFRGERGHREAKGSRESFRIAWTGPHSVELTWSNGDVDALEYDFEISNDTTRQICLCTRGRGVFVFEAAPLVQINTF